MTHSSCGIEFDIGKTVFLVLFHARFDRSHTRIGQLDEDVQFAIAIRCTVFIQTKTVICTKISIHGEKRRHEC